MSTYAFVVLPPPSVWVSFLYFVLGVYAKFVEPQKLEAT